MPVEKLVERARDELFSHINRCGVLHAQDEDQRHWMDETIEYLGERYPDLSDEHLKDLFSVGLRFCRPATPYNHFSAEPAPEESAVATAEAVAVVTDEAEEAHESLTPADATAPVAVETPLEVPVAVEVAVETPVAIEAAVEVNENMASVSEDANPA